MEPWQRCTSVSGSKGGLVRSRRLSRSRARLAAVLPLFFVVALVAAGCSSSSSSSTSTTSGSGGSGAPSSVSSASTSTRGVTKDTINVAFPVVALNSLAGREGFAQDPEFGEQAQAINFYTKQINDSGGINGRKINPIITNFDPTNESSMRALCKNWTEGSPAAFAVLDGIGDWTGDNQLCVTQEGQTPFVGQWTTVTNWTNQGSPYLWWTGPDQAVILQAVVNWGLSSGLLTTTSKVGVLAGLTSVVKTTAADPANTATTDAQAPLAVQELRSAGVASIIPLIPFNVLFPVLQAETAQKYFPHLLLSDYENTITAALGLIPTPYEQALDGQLGLTTLTLGGVDYDLPYSQGGYDTGVRNCWTPWHQAYPQVPPGKDTDFIEEQGPVAGWCQAITLFAAAANAAGPDLNRRTFVTAMSKISDFPGTFSPILSYGPSKRYGPTQYQIVKLHNNVPPSSQCKLTSQGKPQGTCWVSVQPFQPLPTVSGG
jgi:Periplasmic binding protein